MILHFPRDHNLQPHLGTCVPTGGPRVPPPVHSPCESPRDDFKVETDPGTLYLKPDFMGDKLRTPMLAQGLEGPLPARPSQSCCSSSPTSPPPSSPLLPLLRRGGGLLVPPLPSPRSPLLAPAFHPRYPLRQHRVPSLSSVYSKPFPSASLFVPPQEGRDHVCFVTTVCLAQCCQTVGGSTKNMRETNTD